MALTIEQQLYVSAGIFALAYLILLAFVLLIWQQHRSLARRLDQMDKYKPFKIQRAKMRSNPAEYNFTNPIISPGEELARRGYILYNGSTDNLEAAHHDIANNNKLQNSSLKNPMAASPQYVKTIIEVAPAKQKERDTSKISSKQSNLNTNFTY